VGGELGLLGLPELNDDNDAGASIVMGGSPSLHLPTIFPLVPVFEPVVYKWRVGYWPLSRRRGQAHIQWSVVRRYASPKNVLGSLMQRFLYALCFIRGRLLICPNIALGVTTRLPARFGTGAAIGRRMLVAVEGLGVAYPCRVVH
jgi:hypothetical protein